MADIPKEKPKKFMPMLEMLNTEAAVNTLSPKFFTEMVGMFSRKAYENGEIDVDEYLEIVKPLFGETGEMVTEKIKEYEDMDNYAKGGRVNFLGGGETKYNAMVTEMYIKAGGKEGTGMDIDSFAANYFPKMAKGGRIGYDEGSPDPDTKSISARVKEIMDIEDLDFGEAFKKALRELKAEAKD